MYVVCRPFRDAQGMLLAGTYVEPGKVRAFKVRLQDKHIREVTEENFDDIASYLHGRFGVTLKALNAVENEEEPNEPKTEEESTDNVPKDSDKENEAPVEEIPPPKKPSAAKVKIAVKPQ